MAFPKQSGRFASAGIFLLGGLVGLALAKGWSAWNWPVLLLGATGGAWGFWLGSLVGQRVWRWTLWIMSGAIGVIFLAGWLG